MTAGFVFELGCPQCGSEVIAKATSDPERVWQQAAVVECSKPRCWQGVVRVDLFTTGGLAAARATKEHRLRDAQLEMAQRRELVGA